MKYLAFVLFALTATPVMAGAAVSSARLRSWLLSALVFSTALGDVANVNFVSMEFYRGPERGFELGLTDLIALALALVIKKLFFRQPSSFFFIFRKFSFLFSLVAKRVLQLHSLDLTEYVFVMPIPPPQTQRATGEVICHGIKGIL